MKTTRSMKRWTNKSLSESISLNLNPFQTMSLFTELTESIWSMISLKLQLSQNLFPFQTMSLPLIRIQKLYWTKCKERKTWLWTRNSLIISQESTSSNQFRNNTIFHRNPKRNSRSRINFTERIMVWTRIREMKRGSRTMILSCSQEWSFVAAIKKMGTKRKYCRAIP